MYTHFSSTIHILHRICMKFPSLAVKNQTAIQAAWKCRSLPGPLAPPDISRPKRNITARSYSCTTCNKYDTRQPSSTVPRHFITNRELHIKCLIQVFKGKDHPIHYKSYIQPTVHNVSGQALQYVFSSTVLHIVSVPYRYHRSQNM